MRCLHRCFATFPWEDTFDESTLEKFWDVRLPAGIADFLLIELRSVPPAAGKRRDRNLRSAKTTDRKDSDRGHARASGVLGRYRRRRDGGQHYRPRSRALTAFKCGVGCRC